MLRLSVKMILPGSETDDVDQGSLVIVRDREIYETLHDKILLENSVYKKIFGKQIAPEAHRPWKRGIVRIKASGKSIFRLFNGGNMFKIKATEAGIMSSDYHGLELKKGSEIEISRGSRLLFYWNHPNHLNRSAFKLGLVSLFLGLVSLVITIIFAITGV